MSERRMTFCRSYCSRGVYTAAGTAWVAWMFRVVSAWGSIVAVSTGAGWGRGGRHLLSVAGNYLYTERCRRNLKLRRSGGLGNCRPRMSNTRWGCMLCRQAGKLGRSGCWSSLEVPHPKDSSFWLLPLLCHFFTREFEFFRFCRKKSTENFGSLKKYSKDYWDQTPSFLTTKTKEFDSLFQSHRFHSTKPTSPINAHSHL
jgi:hypothetical protein